MSKKKKGLEVVTWPQYPEGVFQHTRGITQHERLKWLPEIED